MSKRYRTYVGADLHKTFTYFIAQDEKGKEVSGLRIENNGGRFREFIAGLRQPVQAVVESTSNWAWFCGEMEGSCDVVVAHARETSAKSDTREKSDVSDARLLATLLRGGLIRRECWQAPDETRQVRERLRHMQFLTRHRTSFKNRIHSVLIRHNVVTPHKDAFCKGGRAFLRSVDLPEEYGRTIGRDLDTIENIEEMLREDLEFCRRMCREDELAGLLTTMPGVSMRLACMIRFETGDIDRFKRHEQYVGYTGIVPGRRQSSGTSRDIGITKEGSFWLRWAFMQAAQTADRQRRGRISGYYWRQFRKTRNRNKAVTATAREMAVIAFHMMKRREPYRETDTTCADR